MLYHKVFTLAKLKGVNLSLTNSNGDTALHLAAKSGREQAVVYLLTLGIDKDRVNG